MLSPSAQLNTPGPTINSVSVSDKSDELVEVPAAIGLAESFGKELLETKFAKSVYYSRHTESPVDMYLSTRFKVSESPNVGSAITKAIFTGLTFFILEPAFWYDFDYTLEGDVDVTNNDGKHIKHSTGKVDATVSTKFLSLGELPNLRVSALSQAKKVLFSQLIAGMRK